MSEGITRPEWVAIAISAVGAFWATMGNWIVQRWLRTNDKDGAALRDNIHRDQRLLQLESDHSAHKQNDDLRFGFIQQSLTRVEGYIAEIRQDIREIKVEKHER